ncbi:site-specific integrase, partial [Christensenellaceae bacterium OttesenSCG-928-K19]|nr:site-specific integrase [Christensenellaceae bacterium OttesenSCG-928-K19]
NNHLYALENMEMKYVLPIDIQNYFNDFAETTLERTNKKPSKALLKDAKSVLSQVFQKGMRDNVATSNPVEGLEMPEAYEGKSRALTEWEQELFDKTATKFLADGSAQQKKFAIVILAMLYAGLRRGEAVAIDMTTPDFDANKLRIRHAIAYNGNQGTYGDPKSEAGVRDIPIMEPLLSPLKKRVEALQAAHKKDTKIIDIAAYKSDEPEEPVFIFSTEQGEMPTEACFDCAWESFLIHVNRLACKEKNVPTPINKWGNPDKRLKMPTIINRITPHMLRHTYATILCESGIKLKTAMVWFGHSDIQLLLEVYSDLRDKHEDEETKKLAAYLNKDKKDDAKTGGQPS